MLPFQILYQYEGAATLMSFRLYTEKGTLYGDYTREILDAGLQIETRTNHTIVIYPGNAILFPNLPNGRYYAVLQITNRDPRYSDVFTVINDIEPYLKIEWWDIEDFVMDAGTIIYKYANNSQFRNILYLPTDLAKPEYIFEEEGETRDGYFFPIKQISEKRYKFSFLAPEYLLDVMRFIRMADFANIYYRGQKYQLDTFLINPTWEDNGDVASVEAEFDTATVAKKIGRGYIQPVGHGDFNDDFNNDFNNQ